MATSLANGLGGAAGFGENHRARNDDGSTPFIDLRTLFGSQEINFFGHQFTGFHLDDNGNLTFAAAKGQHTPTAIAGSTSNPIIAACWADVDTRGGGISSTDTRSGLSSPTPGGGPSRCPTTHAVTSGWDDVGHSSVRTDKLNPFRNSIAPIGIDGDFDITCRYEAVNWMTGDLSGGIGGLGGVPVTPSAPASGTMTGAYGTDDGTATPGIECVAGSGTRVFAAGEITCRAEYEFCGVGATRNG